MALKSIVYKADLQVNDFDNHRYGTYALTIAKHPSETDERMMVRVLAYALNADDALDFGKGLSSDDEPDLWLKDLTGAIRLWIDVGLPDVKSLRKAAGRAEQVILYTYGRSVDIWWRENRSEIERIANLRVLQFDVASTQAAASLTERTMRLQFSVQDGDLLLSSDHGVAPIHLQILKEAATRP